MKFSELKIGDKFSITDHDRIVEDTIYIKTDWLRGEDLISGNCIILYSKEHFVNVHSGELAVVNGNTEVVERKVSYENY